LDRQLDIVGTPSNGMSVAPLLRVAPTKSCGREVTASGWALLDNIQAKFLKETLMKIVVIGGTGLIGSKTVAHFPPSGHEVIAASPSSGVNSITGEGLKEAMAGTQVVIDLANSPSFEDKAVLEFFETSGRNLLAAEAAAGVRYHVALSIVGTDRSDNGY